MSDGEDVVVFRNGNLTWVVAKAIGVEENVYGTAATKDENVLPTSTPNVRSNEMAKASSSNLKANSRT